MRRVLLACLSVMICFNLATGARAEAARNVIIILTDDQGISDVGYNGNPHLVTPNLDALATQSVRFDTFYAHPMCSPSRAALMTGRYPTRLGILDTQSGYSILSPDETTLAEVLKAGGYATGLFGKWHLGDNAPSRPQDQGFDHVLTHEGGMIGMPYNPPAGRSYFDPILLENGQEKRFEGYAPDILVDAAIAFMRSQSAQGRPFFSFLSFNTPHHPLTALEDDAAYYRALGLSEETARYYGMISNLDRGVGRVLDFLAAAGIEEDTIVVFLSDNGTSSLHLQPDLWEKGLRGRKSQTYENGIQVPFLMRLPIAGIAPGSRAAIATVEDVMPTLLALLGIKHEGPFDGRSQAPIIRDPSYPDAQRDLFFQFHRTSAPTAFRNIAVRRGDFKLVQPVGRHPTDPFSPELARFELYDLAVDPFERSDIAARHPEQVEALKAAYLAWLAKVWPGTFEPMRTLVGSAAQNPVMLTRQDWLGGGLSDGDNGTFALQVAQAGTYQITFHASQLLERTTPVQIALGDQRIERVMLGSEIATRIDTIALEEGPTTLSAWMDDEGKRHGFERIEIKRLTSSSEP